MFEMINHSGINPIFSFLVIGGIFSFLGGAVSTIFKAVTGGGVTIKSGGASAADFAQQLREQQEALTKQMNLQAQESKKTLMYVGIGGIGLMLLMFFMMKK